MPVTMKVVERKPPQADGISPNVLKQFVLGIL